MHHITQPLSTAARMAFHSIFNTWLSQASEGDYEQLDAARRAFAPNQVCSAVRLIQGCQSDPELCQQLPKALVQLLQARNWPQLCAAESAA